MIPAPSSARRPGCALPRALAVAGWLVTAALVSACAAALVGRAAGSGGASAASPVRGSAQLASDRTLAETARWRLAADAATKAIPVLVDCREGVLTLRGLVQTREQRAAVERVARGVRGIAGVRNELRVR